MFQLMTAFAYPVKIQDCAMCQAIKEYDPFQRGNSVLGKLAAIRRWEHNQTLRDMVQQIRP